MRAKLDELRGTRPKPAVGVLFICVCLRLLAVCWGGANSLTAHEVPSLQPAIDLFNQHELPKAERRFRAVLAADPKHSEAEFYLGRIALEDGQFGEGIKRLERAVSLDGTNAVCVLWLARAYGLHAQKAGFPSGIGLALKSKAAFEKAIALDPNLIEAREDLVRFHLEAPGIIGGSRRIARAQAGEIKKRDVYTGSLVQGDLLVSEKKFHEAELIYRSASEMKPGQADAYYRLGLLFLENKEFEKAFSALERALQINPKDVAAHFYVGKAGALSGQHLPRAEAALRIYLATKPWCFMPSLAAAHFHLGQIFEWKGDRERARAEFETALSMDAGLKEAKAALKKLR